MFFPQQTTASSAPNLASAADSVATGLSQQAAQSHADSLVFLKDFGQDISQTGKLVMSGQWSRLWEIIAGGLVTKVEQLIPDLVGAIFVFVIFYGAYRVAFSVLRKVLTRSKSVGPGLEHLISKTFRIVVWFFIVVMVLSQFGVNITALLAGLGIAGIAVGLAAKDTLENFISGVTILIDRPFAIGDQVTVEDTYGTVEEITLRSTRVRARDNRIMVMPNVHMINQKIYNHSRKGLLRVEIPFGIAYKERPDEARKALLAKVAGDPRLRSEIPARVVVTKLNDSSIDMELWLYTVDPGEEQSLRWDYTEMIRETLREADIEIPFPHLQLFVDEAKALEQMPITIRNVSDHDHDHDHDADA